MSGHILVLDILYYSLTFIEIIFRLDMIHLRNRSFSTSANSSIAVDSVAEENGTRWQWMKARCFEYFEVTRENKLNVCEWCKKGLKQKQQGKKRSGNSLACNGNSFRQPPGAANRLGEFDNAQELIANATKPCRLAWQLWLEQETTSVKMCKTILDLKYERLWRLFHL